MPQLLNCIDAGTEYCPCYLAETGDCIMCSQLQGKTFCDCKNWKGVCIYQEYVWNRSKVKEGRKECACKVLHKESLSENVIMLTIQVNRTLARELSEPGAYIFIRDENDPHYFDTPMSIMATDDLAETITAAVQVKGIKTKSLREVGDFLTLRGPYWNGIMGLKYIKGLRQSKALLVIRGIGQAPAVPIAGKLRSAGSEVTVILDKGRTGINVGEPFFRQMGCKIVEMQVFDPNSLSVPLSVIEFIKEKIITEGINLVYSGGSEKMHQDLSRLITRYGGDVYFACSNDARICCGEGICGSCQTRLKDGSRIVTCKTQMVPVEIF